MLMRLLREMVITLECDLARARRMDGREFGCSTRMFRGSMNMPELRIPAYVVASLDGVPDIAGKKQVLRFAQDDKLF